MDGAIAVVTGSNRGIGKETALALAGAGMRVVMACRNLEGARSACEEIRAKTGNPKVEVLELDLASRESIDRFAADFAQRFGRLNILVNNAGVSTIDKRATHGRFDPNIGINFVGTFILTTRLLPYFEEGADDRIITLVSNIYKIGLFRLGRIEKYRWFRAYAVSKYMLLLLTLELADRLRDRGISVCAVHPGIVRTSIMYTHKWFDFIIKLMLAPFFIEVEEGAKSVAALALKPREECASGSFFYKMERKKLSRLYDNKKTRARLMDFSALL